MAYFADHEVSHTHLIKYRHDNKLTKALALNKRGADHLLSYLEASISNINHFKPFEILKLQHFMNVDFRVKALEILSHKQTTQNNLAKTIRPNQTAMVRKSTYFKLSAC